MKITVELTGIINGQKTCGKCKYREMDDYGYWSCRLFNKSIGYNNGTKNITERRPECIAAEAEREVLKG
jgi:hypothetical protein